MDLVTRATNIITKPASEWPVIAAESATPMDLITGYAAPLSAIPAIAGFIGTVFLSTAFGGLTGVRIGFMAGIAGAIVRWVIGLVSVYICALIIEKLAPTFSSRGDTAQAMKMVVYSSTPAWVFGIATIIPFLGALVVLLGALYGIYLFYLGLPVVMHTPQDKVVAYMLVSAVVIILINFVLGAIVSALMFGSMMMGGM